MKGCIQEYIPESEVTSADPSDAKSPTIPGERAFPADPPESGLAVLQQVAESTDRPESLDECFALISPVETYQQEPHVIDGRQESRICTNPVSLTVGYRP